MLDGAVLSAAETTNAYADDRGSHIQAQHDLHNFLPVRLLIITGQLPLIFLSQARRSGRSIR